MAEGSRTGGVGRAGPSAASQPNAGAVGAGAGVSEQMSEYLETLYRLEEQGHPAKTGEIAQHLHVAPPSVTDMLQKLEKAGYVTYEPYHGARLTDAGRAIGRRQLEVHRVLQAFLQEVCGMDHRAAHDAACAMEHSVPPPLEQWMAKHLEGVRGVPFDVTRKVKEQIRG